MGTMILIVTVAVFGLGAVAPLIADDESVRPETPTPQPKVEK